MTNKHVPPLSTQNIECDYVEDVSTPNGHYMHICPYCSERFAGHKRRQICKKCYIMQLEDKCKSIRIETLEMVANLIALLPPHTDGPYNSRVSGHQDAHTLVTSMIK